MRRVSGVACVLVGGLVLSGALAADEFPGKVTETTVVGEPAAGPRISMRIEAAGLVEVAEKLSLLSGLPVIVDARLVSDRNLTLSLRDTGLSEAVAKVAEMSGGVVSALPDGGFLIHRPLVKPAPAAGLTRASIPVRWVSASELAWSLGGTPMMGSELKPVPSGPRGQLPEGIRSLQGFDLISSLIVQGTPEAVARMRELVAQLDQPALNVTLGLRAARLSPGAWDKLPELGQTLATDGAAIIVSRDEADELVRRLVRDNLARISKTGLTTRNGEAAELRYGDAAPRTLVLLPRVVGDLADATFLLNSELRPRVAVPGKPVPESLGATTLRLAPGQIAVVRMTVADGVTVLVLIEPRVLPR